MTQTNPNILSYGQAVTLLQQIQNNTSNGSIQDIQAATTQLASAITQFESGTTTPIFKFNKIEFGDPALSSVINQIWTDIASDINILGNQCDILKASAIILFNNTTTAITQIQNTNSELLNQLATISLFNNTVDSKTFIFGDQFGSGGNIDNSFAISDYLAQIDNGYLTLASVGQNIDLTQSATITILPQSNGFPGDNQEVDDPTNVSTNTITSQPNYTFIGASNNPNQPQAILDNHSPNTFFEYEIYQVNSSDKSIANNYNFTYAVTGADTAQYPNSVNSQIDWSSGPSIGYLDLFLQVDLGSVQEINTIVYTPYGLANDVNYPVLIQQISTSSNGVNWVPRLTAPTWVGTVANQQAASVGANVSIGTIALNVGNISGQYVLFEIRQPNSIPCNIGHLYYIDPTTNQRVEGPLPDVSNPSQYYTSGQNTASGYNQFTEVFSGSRWAIGINDISIEQNQYQLTSTMVTKKIPVNGIVDRVALSADIQIPTDFDSTQSWITFSISPDDGVTWQQISPIQNYIQGINEVIAFNDPLPAAFQDSNVTYVNTNQPVDSLRVMIQLSRPASNTAETPIVHDYQVHVRIQ